MSGDGPVGFTAGSFTAVSIRPPRVSFNISNYSSSIAAIRAAGPIAAHVLGAHQEALARQFSGAAADRYADCFCWRTGETGSPILAGTPLVLHADVARLLPVGDHFIVVGMVRSVIAGGDGEFDPLIYHDGRFGRPHALPAER